MNRERDVFLEALDQPTNEARAAFIERATAGDEKLKQAVEALFACQQEGTVRIEAGAAEILRKAMEAEGKFAGGEERIGEVIGRYKLLEKIGEGGFGVVYRAEQTEPVKRHVALKVIKIGMDTRSVVARFEAERQALALMDHPSIARIFDGGATTSGRPYFVMELVRGVRITDYCDANKLPLRERLDLFIQLCHAIQHAHQKGVIHRDLKPSNVLVTLEGGKPIPKVIDFGIAKAIEEPLTEKTILTNFHSFIGTPAYTSPEQAEMTGSDVDTRSDIYSLGVLLYELLTGSTPFDGKELILSGLDGMRRMIKEVEPPTPSSRLRSSTPGSGAIQPWTSIDGDLDSIVMKCLEKDPARRYATAQELPADLNRYLNHEAVLARPQNAVYRFQKTVRRHRTAFAAGVAVLIAVLTGATLSTWQAVRATRAERVAETRRKSEELLRINAEQQRERAVENQVRAERNEYVADVNLASQAIQAGNLTRATELLAKLRNEELRGFEWRYLWNAAKGSEHKVFAQESSSVLSLAHTADSLVVGLRDSVRIYDAKRGSLEKTLDGSGLSVALSTSGLLATASSSTVRVWRSSDWSEAFSLRGHSAPVAFSHDGRLLAANSREGVRIYDASDGHFVSLISNSMPPFAFSPRDDAMAVDTRDGIALWSVNEMKTLRVLQNSEGVFDTRWIRERRILDFSRDGRSIVAARNTLRSGSIFALELWDAATGEHRTTLPERSHVPEHSGTISSIALAPQSQLLASASWDHSIRLWELGNGNSPRALYGNSSEVWALTFSPDGRTIISGAKDGSVRLWPTNHVSKDKYIAGEWSPLQISGDGRILAALRENILGLLNLRTGEVEEEIPLSKAQDPARASRPVHFAGLGSLVSADLGVFVEPIAGAVRVWNLRTKESWDLKTGETLSRSLNVLPDGLSLVISSEPKSLSWWNLKDPSAVPVSIAADRAFFSGNGEVLVAIGERSLAVWDSKTRRPRGNLELSAESLWAVVVSHDGAVLAGSSGPEDAENAIRLWDTRTGKLIGICKGHTQGIGRLAFTPDGKTLVSVSSDSSLRFWNVSTQQELLAMKRIADPVQDLLFSPDGDWLILKTLTGLHLLNAAANPAH